MAYHEIDDELLLHFLGTVSQHSARRSAGPGPGKGPRALLRALRLGRPLLAMSHEPKAEYIANN